MSLNIRSSAHCSVKLEKIRRMYTPVPIIKLLRVFGKLMWVCIMTKTCTSFGTIGHGRMAIDEREDSLQALGGRCLRSVPNDVQMRRFFIRANSMLTTKAMDRGKRCCGWTWHWQYGSWSARCQLTDHRASVWQAIGTIACLVFWSSWCIRIFGLGVVVDCGLSSHDVWPL